jgi:hypothetical protein
MKMLGSIGGLVRSLAARVRSWGALGKSILIAVSALVIIIPVFLILFGSSDGDALATWVGKDGTVYEITRGEAYESMGEAKDRMLQDKAYQKNHLDNMLFQRLQAMDAIEQNMHRSTNYIKRTNDHVENSMLIPEFLKTRFDRQSHKFSLEGRKTRIILVKRDPYNHISEPDPDRFKRMAEIQKTITNQARLQQEMARLEKATITKNIKKTDAEMAAHETNIRARAQAILAEVNAKGADFAALAKEKSDHASASEGGFVGYILPRSRAHSPRVMAALAKLKAGQNTGVIDTQEGFVIAHVDEVVEVERDNLTKYYTDEAKVNYAKNEAWFASVWNFIDKTIADQSGKTVFVYRDKLVSENTNDLVFEVKHPKVSVKITRGDVLKKLNNIPPPRRVQFGIINYEADPATYSMDELWNFFEWEMSFPILKLGAWLTGVAESDAFTRKLREASYTILASLLSEKRREETTVSDEEISAQYEKAMASYVKRLPGGVTQQLTLDEAKRQISNELRSKKINDSFHNWKNELFTRYQAKIYQDRFEVKKKPEPPKPKAPVQPNKDAKPNDGKKNSEK